MISHHEMVTDALAETWRESLQNAGEQFGGLIPGAPVLMASIACLSISSAIAA
jgi:hypothetical protein